MALNDYEEKRSYTRMQVKTPVEFSIKSQPEITHHGISQDLSATGLLMTSNTAPKEGEELDITMNTGSDRLPPFTAIGVVLRVEPTEGEYLISIKLKETT